MYAITETINQYNHEGDYLIAVFSDKPTLAQLGYVMYGESKIENLMEKDIIDLVQLLKGGGRIDNEMCWYHLTELKSGEKYKTKK
jgi:hypothetical protein